MASFLVLKVVHLHGTKRGKYPKCKVENTPHPSPAWRPSAVTAIRVSGRLLPGLPPGSAVLVCTGVGKARSPAQGPCAQADGCGVSACSLRALALVRDMGPRSAPSQACREATGVTCVHLQPRHTASRTARAQQAVVTRGDVSRSLVCDVGPWPSPYGITISEVSHVLHLTECHGGPARDVSP